jgi:malate dehydrogenase (oxaloacetate-decarboxylating)
MEGKAMLLKNLPGLMLFPSVLPVKTPTLLSKPKQIAPVFGGVNLEDIAAPRCFEIESQLQQLDIPVFHDDQHGTAIVTLAALLNGLKLLNRSMSQIRIVINGAGAAGVAIARLLRKAGAENILICDSKGISRLSAQI